MNSSAAVSVGSLFVAARTAAMSAPIAPVATTITLLARRAVSLTHPLCRAAGTARTSSERVRRAERSPVGLVTVGLVMVEPLVGRLVMVGLVMVMVLVLWCRCAGR